MTNAVSNSFIITNNNNFNPKASWQKGDIITGKVEEKNSRTIEVDFNGKVVSMNKNIEIKEKVGEDISFEIEEISKTGLKLIYVDSKKELHTEKVVSNSSNINPRDIVEKNKIKATEFNIKIANKVIDNNITNEKYFFDMANKLKNQIENIVNKVTTKDIEEIIKNNYNPEKISIEVISKIIDKNKVAIRINDLGKLQSEIEDEVNKYANRLGNKEELREIINSLKSFNMPVNEKNIVKLQEVLKKVDSIKNLSNKDIINIIKHNKEFTIENIYKSKFLGNSIKNHNINYKVDKDLGYAFEESSTSNEINNIEELEPQIIKILQDTQIEPIKENIKLAKELIKNEIPLNKETLNIIKNLENNIANIAKEDILKQSIENIIIGKNPAQIFVAKNHEKKEESNEQIKKLLNTINMFDIEEVKKCVKNEKANQINTKVNSENLEKTLENISKVNINDIKTYLEEEKNVSIKDIKIIRLLLNNNIINSNDIENEEIENEKIGTKEELLKSLNEDKVQQSIKEEIGNQNHSDNIKKTEQLINDIKKIDLRGIKKVIINEKIINFKNLIEDSDSIEDLNTEEIKLDEAQSAKAIRTRLNIEEIRLKMTIEAATRLNLKGIKVEIEPIDTIVKELRNIDREEYRKALEINDIKSSKDNLDKIEEVYEKINVIKNMPPKVMKAILNKEVDFTIERVASATEKELVNELKLNKFIEKYDDLSTKPRPDLGDKIEKTFNQIDHILDELGLEITEKNIRAVKILAKNEMEISIDNIEGIKLIDNKLIKITQGLHPNIVVSMIKDQMSPIKMHVDEVIQYMSNFEEQLGETSLEKIAEHIHNLEEGNLSKEERESLIGIYRMLTTISKSEGTAIGFLMKNNLELNLDNLFEAAKYIKSTKGTKKAINANIDDNFGVLKELRYSEKSIKEQILTALKEENIPLTKNNINMATTLDEQNMDVTEKQVNKFFNNNEAIIEFISKAYPTKILQLEKEGELKKQLEKLNDLIPKENVVNKKEISDLINKLKELSQLDKESLKDVEKYGISKDLNSLNTIRMLKDNPFELSRRLENIIKTLDNPRNIETDLKNSINKIVDSISNGQYEDVVEEIKESIEEIYNELLNMNGGIKDNISKEAKAVENIVKFQQNISKEENYYQIPIMIGNELKQLNLYLFNNKNNNTEESTNGMKIHMYFETENMGSIQAYVDLKGNNMNFGIYTNEKEDLNLIKNFENEIKSILTKTMYNIGDIDYSYFKGESPISSDPIKNTQNKEHKYYDSKFEKII